MAGLGASSAAAVRPDRIAPAAPAATRAADAAPLLSTRHLTRSFRSLVALKNHQIDVRRGEIVGVIGPNGSGKSTLFNVITGFLRPDAGTVSFAGQPIERRSAGEIVRLGIARTFQGTRLFQRLTVAENIRAAAQLRHPTNMLDALFGTPRLLRAEAAVEAIAAELLGLVGLGGRAQMRAGDLPYGDQRRLELMRALATRPQVLMLDEPAAGMDAAETRSLLQLIDGLRRRFDLAVIVVEHDMDLIMNLCERIQVLAHGETIFEGRPAEVQADARVREVYLGHSAARSAEPARPAVAAAEPLLVVKDLRVSYGAVAAIKGVSITVAPGEVVALLGANGAGKSTMLRTISGLSRPRSGEIWLAGQRIDRMPPPRIVRLGIAHGPEGRRLFGMLSVAENLRLGAAARSDAADVARDRERMLDLFPILRERIGQQAGTLSGGEQQMLALARALMARPKLLLLDEPSLGIAPIIMQSIFRTLAELKRAGTTMLLVEQNISIALELADRAYVLRTGEVALAGQAQALAADYEQVAAAYLGARA